MNDRTDDLLVPPCPGWCVRPADHDLDEIAQNYDGSVLRQHCAGEWTVATFGSPVRVLVDWTVLIGASDAMPDDPPSIVVLSNDPCLTGSQARELSAALTAAGKTLAAIEEWSR